jgi:hypothetical protein
MQFQTFTIQNLAGDAVASATVSVREAVSQTTATIYDANGAALSQPLTTDATGKVTFAAPDGTYDIVVTGSTTSETLRNVQFYDPEGLAFDTVAELTAYTGSEMVEGTFVQVRGTGRWYIVGASGASGQAITTAGGDKLFESGPYFSSFDNFETAIAIDQEWADGDMVEVGTATGTAKFKFDPDGTGTGAGVYSPAGGGRFNLAEGAEVPLSAFGLISSSTLDQSTLFQDAAKVYSANRWNMLFDLARVDCGGGQIWWNVEGAHNGYSTGTRFHWRGAHRNYCTLSNVYLSFGKTYTDESVAGDGSDLRWSISRQPTSQGVLTDMEINGCTRFINVEGTAFIARNKFEPETSDTNFLSSLPGEWGQNSLGVTDANGDAVSQITYASVNGPFAVCEFLYCNHATILSNNFQNGKNFTTNGGSTLNGVTMAQCSNPALISGRTVSNRQGLVIGEHPVYGGTGLSNVGVYNLHVEENTEEAVYITHGKNINVNIQGRPIDDGDDMTAPMVRVGSASNAPTNVHLSGYFTGPGSNQGGATAIRLDGGVNCSVQGYVQDFGVGVDANDTERLGALNCTFDNVDDEIRVAGGVHASVEHRAPAVASPLGTLPYSIAGSIDLALPSHLLREYNGTGVTTFSRLHQNDYAGLEITIPASGAEDMTAGAKLATGQIFSPAHSVSSDFRNAMAMNASILADASQVAWFIGFSSVASGNGIPGEVTGAGAVTATETDFVGFLFSRYTSGATIHIVARDDGGTTQVVDTGVEFGSSTPPKEMYVEVQSNGDARFRIDGQQVDLDGAGDYLLQNAVDASELFGACVCVHSMTSTEVKACVPYVCYYQERART